MNNKMAITTYLSLITLYVNGLYAPIKDMGSLMDKKTRLIEISGANSLFLYFNSYCRDSGVNFSLLQLAFKQYYTTSHIALDPFTIYFHFSLLPFFFFCLCALVVVWFTSTCVIDLTIHDSFLFSVSYIFKRFSQKKQFFIPLCRYRFPSGVISFCQKDFL